MYTMRPSPFDYHRPTSLDEALDLLSTVPDARPIAGGHSLLPLMKLRLVTPTALVDIGRLGELTGVSVNGQVTIGALTTHATVAADDSLRRACPVLAETAASIGDRQVRNRGTIGGSAAHADPAADYPTVLKALGATIAVAGQGGTRDLSADDFFVDVFTTALQPGELVTSVRVPAARSGTATTYLKHRHPASSYAVVGVAATVTLDGDACTDAQVAIGGTTATPVRVEGIAEALRGRPVTKHAAADAGSLVAAALDDPLGDTYASGEYRVHLASVLTARALVEAAERASSS